jgi:hypothetical protein
VHPLSIAHGKQEDDENEGIETGADFEGFLPKR